MTVLLVACSSASPPSSSAGRQYRFYMVTHGDNGSFWSVVQRAARRASMQAGVSLSYQGSNNDDALECRDIEAAVSAKAEGLIVSPHSPQVLDCAKQAAAHGIPLVLINICGTTASGESYVHYTGALTCMVQPESDAGTAAGRRFKTDGVTHLLCVIHEATNTALRDRCAGAKAGFAGPYSELVIDNAKSNTSASASALQAKLSADPSIDGILSLDADVTTEIVEPAVVAAHANSHTEVGSFDLSVPIVDDIKSGKVAWTVDQQEYLYGYEPIFALKLYKEGLFELGAQDVIKTGPSFDDRSNIDRIAQYVRQGIR